MGFIVVELVEIKFVFKDISVFMGEFPILKRKVSLVICGKAKVFRVALIFYVRTYQM